MSITGELITETFEYDGGREVTVHVPAEPPEAVVFAGDGQLISQWGGVLETAGVPSTMIEGSSSRTCAGGCGRVSEPRCPPAAPRCSVSRRAESSRSPSGSGIRMSTVRSSAPHRAEVTGRLV